MTLAPFSIRTYLLVLVCTLMVPAVIFAGLMLWTFHRGSASEYRRDALELSRHLSTLVDREISASIRAAQVLSTSALFRERRLPELYAQVVQAKQFIGAEIIIKEPSGQQLVNTRLPFGTALPLSLPEADRRALEAKQPTVTDLFVGETAARPILSVNVPIIEGDAVVGLINTAIEPDRLSELLRPQTPEGWTAAIIDRKDIIIGRSTSAERFVGSKATDEFRERARGREGSWTGKTVEGVPVMAAHNTSNVTGWRTVVGIPEAVVQAPLWRSLLALVAATTLAILLSFFAAYLLARPLSRWTRDLTNAAGAIGLGKPFIVPRAPVIEFVHLSKALDTASKQLLALRTNLEAQVEERTRQLTETHHKLLAEVQQREAIEDKLRQSQKMEAVGQLTGGLAHDFNNLLAIISGSLQLLQRRHDRGEFGAMQKYVDAALEGSSRAAKLTHRLLAFARQQPLNPRSTDVNALLSNMSDLLHRSLGELVTIETVVAAGLWRTHVDENQLENAILNLVLNARDAMPDGGKLTIETANAELDHRYAAENPGSFVGQYVLISVTDSGCGMSPETLGRAFDPFFTTKHVGQGTGLGLSQVYGFVHQSGGHVKIYSEEGIGTSVKVYLPRFLGELPPEATAASMETQEASESTTTVLVVEDDPAVRKLSLEYFNELGYRTIEAEDGAAALRVLDSNERLQLLFTDVVMPNMNGKRLAEEALRRRPKLKVLFTSGYTRNAIVHRGIVDPDVLLLAKPYTLQQLAQKVREVLGS